MLPGELSTSSGRWIDRHLQIVGEQKQKVRLNAGDALIIVDVQNDFLVGGALPVKGGAQIIPVLNQYVSRFVREHLPIFATRAWYPPDHCSFKSEGGRAPVHCVADSKGAQFPSTLNLPPWTVVVSRDTTPHRHTYSGFAGADLEQRLRGSNLRRLFVGGLSTDYCVLYTVKDALKRGFEVFLLRDAIRAANLKPGDGDKAEADLIRLGAVPIELKNLIEETLAHRSSQVFEGDCDAPLNEPVGQS